MTSNFLSPEHRPDPTHWTRTNVGFTSPLWWPFLMAAGAGAAWWTYTNWSRIATSSWTGDLQRLGGDPGGDGSETRPRQPTGWSLDQNLAVQGGGAFEAEDDEPEAGVDDGSDAIDAAYAANLGPVPTPRKRAAARKGGGAAAMKKTSTKAAPARKAPAKKAAAKKTAAKKTAAKKTAAKKSRAKRGR